ncbi:MAG: hypothetical protein SynsKO_01020 [Synoicihabitans sp.]
MNELNLWLGFGNILCGVIFAALALPLWRGKVKPNDIYGIRFSAARKSEEAWYRWNRVGGRYMFIWSIVIALVGIVCLWWPPLEGLWIWFFGLAPALVGIGCIQTFVAGRRG